MADDASNDGTVFVASHEKAKNGFGQNGYQGASSLTPGQTKPNIPNVSTPTPGTANANAADDQKRLGEIMAHPIAAHPGLQPRAVDSGSPGGKIPAANLRRDSGKKLLK